MRVVYVNSSRILKRPRPAVLVIGVFDGIHLGHQQILKVSKRLALRHNLSFAVLTFDPHPKTAITNKSFKLIQTFSQRLDQLSEFGVEYCYVVNFNKKIARLKAEDFASRILKKISASFIVVGEDFRFAKDRKADAGTLKRLGFRLKVVKANKAGNVKISSSLIRHLLSEGDIKRANRLLGRPYSIKADVIKGMGLGRKLGFPTLNLNYDKNVILPTGVFLSKVKINGRFFKSAAYIGYKPSLGKVLSRPVVEVHVISKKVLPKPRQAQLFLLKKIRQDICCKSLQQLRLLISKDISRISRLKS